MPATDRDAPPQTFEELTTLTSSQKTNLSTIKRLLKIPEKHERLVNTLANKYTLGDLFKYVSNSPVLKNFLNQKRFDAYWEARFKAYGIEEARPAIAPFEQLMHYYLHCQFIKWKKVSKATSPAAIRLHSELRVWSTLKASERIEKPALSTTPPRVWIIYKEAEAKKPLPLAMSKVSFWAAAPASDSKSKPTADVDASRPASAGDPTSPGVTPAAASGGYA